MKLHEFDSMADGPRVFTLDKKRLLTEEVNVTDAEGKVHAGSCAALLKTLLDEGIVKCDWHDPGAFVRTKRTEYKLPLLSDARASTWQFFCLECHLAARDASISDVAWFFYEHGHVYDHTGTCDTFFVSPAA